MYGRIFNHLCSPTFHYSMEEYHPRVAIDETKTYKIDKFLRRFNNIGANNTFLPGGRYFVMSGKTLKMLVEKSPDFEEEQLIIQDAKKRNVCFLGVLDDRNDLIGLYRKLFYTNRNPKSLQAFNNLCVRVRKQRYTNRQCFNYLIVKQLQCKTCENACVYKALKNFYKQEKKCVAQVDNLIAKENGFCL
ncbi:LEF-2 [Choristoneura occidentalis granulovirus]|uniref:LEF-2 n=1 Tax=Choristoneura occidentalis granulovirus TaxID=364745 RepID=Q1A4R7_9BBAC|nr:LEF-2 [Choristoneura fumiferana granulovirus]ABC61163.1 LEF-2 [Choristoneura fumiferana granulovirus]